MFSAIEIVCRSFYDKNLFHSFVKNGKGWGLHVLIVLSVLTSFLLMFQTYSFFSLITPQLIETVSEKTPDMTVHNGRIETPEPIVKQFYLTKNIPFIIDTSYLTVPEGTLASGVYLYKTAVVFVDTNGKKSQMPLTSIFGSGKVDITAQKTKRFLNEFVPYARKTIPVMTGLISIPIFFLKLLLLSYIFSLLSHIPFGYFHIQATNGERMRLATLSLAPVTLFSIIFSLFSMRFFGGLWTESLISLMYMFYYVYPVDLSKETDKNDFT